MKYNNDLLLKQAQVIWNISSKKCILWARDIKSMFFFNCYYIIFQDVRYFSSVLSQ